MVLDLIDKELFISYWWIWLQYNNFEVDMSSSVHADNNKKYILILGDGPTKELDGTILTAEEKYSISFTVTRKIFCLNLHYIGANNYLFVNGTEIIKFKAKDSEINAIPLCLWNISKKAFCR